MERVKFEAIDLNLFNSPYFSFIGNLGSSRKSLVGSITPECCPKAKLKFKIKK